MIIKIKSCIAKGNDCIATDLVGNKWVFHVYTEGEAISIADAISNRKWITDNWWKKK